MSDEAAHPSERLILWKRSVGTGEARRPTAEVRDAVAARLQAAGGETLLRAGGSIACAFDPMDLERVVAVALELLANPPPGSNGFETACGVALGPQPDALDRAQLLANRADAGELALDDGSHEIAESTHLFVRMLQAGAVFGEVVDARFPNRKLCRPALSLLRPVPLPPGMRPSFDGLRERLAARTAACLALRGSHQPALRHWVERLTGELAPPLVLRVGPSRAHLRPLGALALAVGRLDPERYAKKPTETALAQLAAGAPLKTADAADALSQLLTGATDEAGPAWLLLEGLQEIDPPSLGVLAELLRNPAAPFATMISLAPKTALPRALVGERQCDEILFEALSVADRQHVAGGVLGLPADSDIARRVALLGGNSELGILEAARTLVSAGDLVPLDGAFRWRTVPRRGSVGVPTDALITERVAGLDTAAHRILEGLCVTTSAQPRRFVAALSQRDGLDAESIARGFQELSGEGWCDERGELGPLESAIRAAVRNAMPPARAAELHRFAAGVLASELGDDHAFALGELAHHLAEGGQEQEAARALLDAAAAASGQGLSRMAVRLAANALKLDDDKEVRQRARSIARSVEERPQRPKTGGTRQAAGPTRPSTAGTGRKANGKGRTTKSERGIANSAIRAAIRAVIGRDSEAADNFIDTAVAAGWGRAGAQRLAAISRLARGDVAEAVRTLKQSHLHATHSSERTREAITAALILLESGDAIDAIRSGLDALAHARSQGDARGEAASLLVLSACYRVLGRDDDADRIATVIEA